MSTSLSKIEKQQKDLATREEKHAAILADIAADFKAAQDMSDAGEKYLALHALGEKIEKSKNEVMPTVDLATGIGALVGLIAGIAYPVSWAIAAGGFLPALWMFPGIVTGILAGGGAGTVIDSPFDKRKKEKFSIEYKDVLASLAATVYQLDEMKTKMTLLQLADLVNSSKAADLGKKFPDIKKAFDHFASAHAQAQIEKPQNPDRVKLPPRNGPPPQDGMRL